MTTSQNVDSIIAASLPDPNTVFVFPSQITASAYADRALLRGNGGALLMDRFIAWDSFLEEAFTVRHKNKKAASAVVRRIFAEALLEKNEGGAIFKTIIAPKYAKYSKDLAPFFARILPELSMWEQYEKDMSRLREGEAEDYRALTAGYKDFLEKNNLFEASWEKPPFVPNGKRYILFFTETLQDFSIYKDLLLSAKEHITIVKTDGLDDSPAAAGSFEKYFLSNFASEVKAAALYILKLREAGTDYRDIVITSPLIKDYTPFITAEFANYSIPFQNGAGQFLSEYQAGRLFRAIENCVAQKMALPALEELLLNRAIPWKDENLINHLISYGAENNCICALENDDEKKGDIWELSFERKPPFMDEKSPVIYFYRNLKRALLAIVREKSFRKAREYYFAFYNKFIDDNRFTENPLYSSANKIIRRSIAELSILVRIEKEYPDMKMPSSPWKFFTRHLESTLHKEENSEDGVQLAEYRVGSSFPSVYRIVLGANQNAMPQIFKSLSFLSSEKRKHLNLDTDASNIFFKMQIMSTEKSCAFFFAEESFSGFTIPFSGLNAFQDGGTIQKLTDILKNKDKFLESYYDNESAFFDTFDEKNGKNACFAIQKEGFEHFSSRHTDNIESNRALTKDNAVLKDYIAKRYKKEGVFSVSSAALKPYYNCAMQWILQNVLDISAIDAEAAIMNPFAKGTLYHDVLSECFKGIKNKSIILQLTVDNEIPSLFLEILDASIEKVFSQLITPILLEINNGHNESALTAALLLPQKDALKEKCILVLKKMFSEKEFAMCRVIEVEPEPDWTITNENYILKGRPDLILQDDSGNYVIVDFKSSAYSIPSVTESTGMVKVKGEKDVYEKTADGMKDFQLSIYQKLAENQELVPTEGGVFVNIKDAKVEKRFSHDKIQFSDARKDLEEKIARYVREVIETDFENSYSASLRNCMNCDYKSVCRTVFTIQKETRLAQKKGAHNG